MLRERERDREIYFKAHSIKVKDKTLMIAEGSVTYHLPPNAEVPWQHKTLRANPVLSL